jgi:hypothetical protein
VKARLTLPPHHQCKSVERAPSEQEQSEADQTSDPPFPPQHKSNRPSNLILVPAVRVSSSALRLTPLAPTAVVELDTKRTALGGLAVLAPVGEGHERVSVADADVGGGGVVEGAVGVAAEAVVVLGAGQGEGWESDEEGGDLL